MNSYCDSGIFGLYASTAHDKIPELITRLITEICKICQQIESTELERAKAQVKATFLMAEESTAFKSEEIGRNYSLFHKFIKPEQILATIENIKPHNLQDIAKKIFSSKPVVSAIGTDISTRVNYEAITKQLQNC